MNLFAEETEKDFHIMKYNDKNYVICFTCTASAKMLNSMGQIEKEVLFLLLGIIKIL